VENLTHKQLHTLRMLKSNSESSAMRLGDSRQPQPQPLPYWRHVTSY